MIDKSTWQGKRECILISCILHGTLLILISLHQTDLQFISKKKEAPVILYKQPVPTPAPTSQVIDPLSVPALDAPCILYKPGDPNAPQVSLKKKGKQKTPAPSLPALTPPTQRETISPTTAPSPESSSSLHKPPSSPSTGSVSQPKKIATPKSATFLATKTDRISEENKAEANENNNTTTNTALKVDKIIDTPSSSEKASQKSSQEMRKRPLTLADLFKNLSTTLPLHSPQFAEGTDGESDEGAPAVIVQGDIRYHSFFKDFLDHINSTSAYNNGNTIVRSLLVAGKIKQNLKLSVTLEKSGKVLDARILVSSGCPELDAFWVNTAHQASPFAPLPTHFKRDMVRVELVTQL